jgi:antitoxin HicB
MSKHIGSTLESLFDEMGERREFELLAMKKTIAACVQLAMQKRNFNQAQLARAMGSERVQVQRLLDPENTSCTLATLASAFTALGLKLEVSPKGRVAKRVRIKARRGIPASERQSSSVRKPARYKPQGAH